MKDKNHVSRRHFITSMLAASVAPQFIPRRVLGGKTVPSRKIRLGHIGTGGEVVRDPKAYRIKSPEALNAQMSCKVRGSWQQR